MDKEFRKFYELRDELIKEGYALLPELPNKNIL
jgi:hypothetical protein